MSASSLVEGARCLTFDCYGTLIDWDRGVREAVRAAPSLAGCDVERLLADREASDRELTATGYVPYDAVLRRSLRAAAARQERELSDAEARDFALSMRAWPPFADSSEALLRLKRRYRLAILSNVQRTVLEASVAALEVDFDALVTAEELRSYKPRRAHFDAGLERLGARRDEVLHVAGSLYHDVAPALALGFRCAWIDRRGEGDAGALAPTLVCASMAELADELLGPS